MTYSKFSKWITDNETPDLETGNVRALQNVKLKPEGEGKDSVSIKKGQIFVADVDMKNHVFVYVDKNKRTSDFIVLERVHTFPKYFEWVKNV